MLPEIYTTSRANRPISRPIPLVGRLLQLLQQNPKRIHHNNVGWMHWKRELPRYTQRLENRMCANTTSHHFSMKSPSIMRWPPADCLAAAAALVMSLRLVRAMSAGPFTGFSASCCGARPANKRSAELIVAIAWRPLSPAMMALLQQWKITRWHAKYATSHHHNRACCE